MHKLLALVSLAILAVTLSAGESKEAPVVPARYKSILQTKTTRLALFLGTTEQPPAFGHTAAFSADGKFALYTTPGVSDPDTGQTSDSLLTLWDVAKSQAVKEITAPKEVVSALALGADAKTALTGLVKINAKGEHAVRLALWDLSGGKEIHSFAAGADVVACAAIAPSGKRALAGTILGTLYDLDLEKGKAVTFKNEKGTRMLDVAFDRTGARAVSTWLNDFKLWDVENGKALQNFKGHREWVLSAVLSPDGKRAASFSGDDEVRLWDTNSAKEIGLLKKGPFNNSLVSLCFVGDKQVALAWSALDPMTATQDQSFVLLWDGKKELWTHKVPLKGLAPLVVQGDRLLVGGGANPFYLFRLADGALEKSWGGHKGAVTALALDAKGRLLSAGQDGSFFLWDKGNPKPLVDVKEGANSVAIPAQGGLFALSGPNHTIRLLDLEAGKTGKHFTGHTGQVTHLAWSDNLLASASADRTIKVWLQGSAKEKNTLTGHGDAVNAVAFSPKGDWLASASDDNSVRVWNLQSIGNKKVPDEEDSTVYEGHKRQVTCLWWLDNYQLFSGSQDMTIKLWDVKKNKLVRTFQGHTNWITSLIVVGNYLISASDDLTVRLWDVKSGKEVDRIDLGPAGDGPRSLARGRDQNTFYVGTAGWVILRFEIPPLKK